MKKLRIRKLTAVFLSLTIVLSIFAFSAVPAKSATAKLTEISPDKVYTNLDVTGDGKADRFKIQRPKWKGSSRPYYKSFTISVNGKTALSYKLPSGEGYFNLNSELIALANGKKFLFITCGNGDTYRSFLTAVFQYKSGKFVKVLDFDQYCKRHAYSWYAWPSTVKGNAVDFGVSMYSPGDRGYFNGELKMQFVYQSGTLKQNSSACVVNDEYYRTIRMGKNVWAYTTTARTKNAFKLLAGETVTVDQCRISSTRMLLRVKKGSRYGWILLGKGVIAYN